MVCVRVSLLGGCTCTAVLFLFNEMKCKIFCVFSKRMNPNKVVCVENHRLLVGFDLVGVALDLALNGEPCFLVYRLHEHGTCTSMLVRIVEVVEECPTTVEGHRQL